VNVIKIVRRQNDGKEKRKDERRKRNGKEGPKG
jgi:hypothetical protein